MLNGLFSVIIWCIVDGWLWVRLCVKMLFRFYLIRFIGVWYWEWSLLRRFCILDIVLVVGLMLWLSF